MKGGPAEEKVRKDRANRISRVLDSLPHDAESCFAGLFNGALSEGRFSDPNDGGAPDGLCIGKAECEWAWPEGWYTLRSAGLITYEYEERDNHPTIGGRTKYLKWKITDYGWDVREDDLVWFRELMAAYEADRVTTDKPGVNPDANKTGNVES